MMVTRSQLTNIDDTDLKHLRRAIRLADAARKAGERPFGAVIVHDDGTILIEAVNQVNSTGDVTAHAETQAIRLASTSQVLNATTLYSSAEPCVMCAGAIFWSRIPRLVYGLDDPTVRSLAAPDEAIPTVRSEPIVNCSPLHQVLVLGPALIAEVMEVLR
jgi:tRNA(Arg) A34 adenosine deaminase TadA